VIKYFIARSGSELDVHTKGAYGNTTVTALEIATEARKTMYSRRLKKITCADQAVAVLTRFNEAPSTLVRELQSEFGLFQALVAGLFALTVLLSDGYLRLKGTLTASADGRVRFFVILEKLPMELQMVVCHRVQGSAKENIHSQDTEVALKVIVREFGS